MDPEVWPGVASTDTVIADVVGDRHDHAVLERCVREAEAVRRVEHELGTRGRRERARAAHVVGVQVRVERRG